MQKLDVNVMSGWEDSTIENLNAVCEGEGVKLDFSCMDDSEAFFEVSDKP